MNLRQINDKDQLCLKKVYFDSIKTIDNNIYSLEQKFAWSSQAWENPNFEKSIAKGSGWLIHINGSIVAFASRYPKYRVSLFYCMGKFQRKASLISYKLFLKNNWEIVRKEKIIIKNKYFERYKMKKILN